MQVSAQLMVMRFMDTPGLLLLTFSACLETGTNTSFYINTDIKVKSDRLGSEYIVT